MKRSIFIIFLLLFWFKSHSRDFDTSRVILNAKINIFLLNNPNWNKAELLRAIDANCNFIFIKSSGFDHVVFFKIAIVPRHNNVNEFNKFFNEGSFLAAMIRRGLPIEKNDLSTDGTFNKSTR